MSKDREVLRPRPWEAFNLTPDEWARCTDGEKAQLEATSWGTWAEFRYRCGALGRAIMATRPITGAILAALAFGLVILILAKP